MSEPIIDDGKAIELMQKIEATAREFKTAVNLARVNGCMVVVELFDVDASTLRDPYERRHLDIRTTVTKQLRR